MATELVSEQDQRRLLDGSMSHQPTAAQWSGVRPAAGADLVGTVVSHYAILKKIGGGSQGVVHLAVDLTLDRRVALKFLLPELCQDDIAMQRFAREARACAAAIHRNICTIHGLGSTADGQPFIDMAYCDGLTLKRRLEHGALPIDEAVTIAIEVADGLAAAHAHGVVHRDIKPGNLMLTTDGVRILDFGLARLTDSLQLTLTSAPMGTAAYMSPEQSRGQDADARSDVWATGVVLYEMLAGVTPFARSHPDAVGFAIRNDPPPALTGRVRGVSANLEAVVYRALHKDPRCRFQSARDLARALRMVQSGTTYSDAARRAYEHVRARWPRQLVARLAAYVL